MYVIPFFIYIHHHVRMCTKLLFQGGVSFPPISLRYQHSNLYRACKEGSLKFISSNELVFSYLDKAGAFR